ncbi:MAG: winged helix-turn-helix transcriptional regulator [Acidobacteria bacterium]|nr:winged helix-turn-helix transcriptional regulator [Acidobacteriota bacterium]
MSVSSKILHDCLATRVRRINRIVTSIYDEALRPYGLKISQMNILVAAGTRSPARPAELARALDIDPSTLSRNLRILHRHGWIEFLEDSEDARAQPFHVTAAGCDLIDRAYPAWNEAQRKTEQALGPDVVEALMKGFPAD